MILTDRVTIINNSDIENDINSKASETDAIAEEQRIYYRTSSASAPTAPTSWVTSTSTANTTWTTKRMQYDSTNKYLYTCIQKKTVSGAITNSTVLLDDTTTVIDGGTIITGTVNANALNATNINSSGILTISAMSSDTQDDILNSNIDVPQTVAELQDAENYATKLDVNAVDNFVKSHIEIDGSTMSLVADSTLAKLVMSTVGLSLYGNGGTVLAEYGEDAIIGNKSSFHIRIVTSNNDPDLNGIFFYQAENPVAYINSNRLYISQSVVLQQMDVGTPMNNGVGGQWSWKVHENTDGQNNLYLKWLG